MFVGAEEIQCNIDTQCKKNKQSNYLVIYSTISYSFLKDDLKQPGYLCIFLCICSCVVGDVYCFVLFCFFVPHIHLNMSFSSLVIGSQDRELDELSPIYELYIICWATLVSTSS